MNVVKFAPLPTLWRHYTGRFLRAFAAATVILALLLLVVDTLLHTDDILDAHRPFGAALRALVLESLADNIAYLLPLAAFGGAFWTTGFAARALEVLALRAGGIAPLSVFAPLLLLALPIGLGGFALAEIFGTRAAATTTTATVGAQHSERVEVHGGVVWYRSGRVIYSGREPDASGARIADARVFERDAQGRIVRQVQAARARRLSPEQWQFEDAVIREFDPARVTAPPRVTHASNITLALPSKRGLRLRPRELEALPLAQLARHARELERAGVTAGGTRALLHERLSASALAPLFALFALALGLRSERKRSLAGPALAGVVLLALFLSLRERGAALAFELGGAFWILPWVMIAIAGAVGVFLLARTPR